MSTRFLRQAMNGRAGVFTGLSVTASRIAATILPTSIQSGNRALLTGEMAAMIPPLGYVQTAGRCYFRIMSPLSLSK